MFKESTIRVLNETVHLISKGNVSVSYTDKAMRDNAIYSLNSKLKELT